MTARPMAPYGSGAGAGVGAHGDGAPRDDADPATAQTALVAAARELMRAVGLTEADVAVLEEARATVEALTHRLEERTRPRLRRVSPRAAIEARAAGRPHERGLSTQNPMGLPLQVRIEGDEARGWLTANALCEGPPEGVHGGVIGWLMDTILGVLVQARGQPSVTATLEIRYRERTPIDVPLELGSTIVRRSGRRLVVEGWIEAEGRRTVEATGLFVALRDEGRTTEPPPDADAADGSSRGRQ